ncbi:MAG: hypothetical protein ACYTFK_14365 [Planctomycetota bacterium]|jgi:hypothetical protein
MNSEQIYQNWKEQRCQIEVDEDFTDMVMNRICRYEQGRRKPLLDVDGFVEFISGRPFAKVGLIVAGGVIGFVRVALMIHVFLFA